MKPEKINKLLDKMLGLAEGDVEATYNAWRIAHDLYHFFSEIDAGIYHDDPMSQSAPFECFDAHMERWVPLNKRLNSFDYIHAEEMNRRLEFEQQNPDIEGVPF
jgi:hypothetical protein